MIRVAAPPLMRPKPFLKWAGGKRQLLDTLLQGLPEFDAYHEPFLGGGALFFELAARGRIRRATLSDLNPELIHAYVAVQNQVEKLIVALRRHAHKHSEAHFYQVRDRNPNRLQPVARAARLIYLNKTCYNGLYRVNSQGGFNVPFGRYQNPLICDAENLRACSRVLQGVTLECRAFETVRDIARKDDLVYFDPPYYPVSKTANFAAYEKSGFGADAHQRLKATFDLLAQRGCYVLLSNSHCAFTCALFPGAKTVRANRAVNSQGAGRGPVNEILLRNF